MLGLLLDFLFKLLNRRIRRSRIARFAESHGWSFRAEESGSGLSVSADIFSQEPSKVYKLSSAANVMRGSLRGLGFTYFEKTLIVDSGFSVGEAAGARSVVAIDGSASEYFERGEALDKDLAFYRENGGICFWWHDTNSPSEAISVRELERWLADIASTFKTGASKASTCP